MIRRISVLCISAVLVSCSQKPQGGVVGADASQAVAVRAVKATTSDIPLNISAIGNVEAVATVEIKARMSAPVTRVLFEEGQDVRRGQLLFELDPEPTLRQIAENEANLAKDMALEKQARANVLKDQATLRQARAQADRGATLAKEGIFSKEQTEQSMATADSAEASLQANQAAVESALASIKADQARLAENKLQLSFTKITAPMAGRAGAIMAKQGNVVRENDTTMVTVLQTAPVYVSFSINESLLPDLRKNNAQGALQVSALGNDKIPEVGKLSFIDSSVDQTTGQIKLKAVFSNPKRTLWPGQYVTVETRLEMERGRILVPSRTVQTGPKGSYVWVMDQGKNVVQMRDIQVLRNIPSEGNDQAVVSKGLGAGEMVISEGQLHLAPGAHVRLLQQAPQAAESSRENTVKGS